MIDYSKIVPGEPPFKTHDDEIREPLEQEIEQLEQQLAEKDAALLEVKAQVETWLADNYEKFEALEQQLAECQVDNKRLRDALGKIAEIDINNSWSCQSGMAKEALTMPSDSTALDIPDVIRQRRWQREVLLEMMVVYNQMAISGVAYSFYDKLASKAKELE